MICVRALLVSVILLRSDAELDFILVSEGIDVRDFRVPDVRYSDHRPVICDFEIRA